VFALAGWSAGRDLCVPDDSASWARLLRIAGEENALLALRDHLRRPGAEAPVPPDVQRQLAFATLHIQSRMATAERRVEALLVALNAAGIEPLLLKGAALAATIYPSWRDRPMRDIDLMVREDEIPRTRSIVLELGWVPDPTLPGDRTYATHQHLPPFDAPGLNCPRLEVHRALLPGGHPFSFTQAELYARAARVAVGEGRALVMDPHHHAVYIAMHFVWSHQLWTGGWHAFRDLASLAARDGFDWQVFASIATRWGAATCAYWTLRFGRSLAGLAVPAGITEQLRPAMPAAVLARLDRHFVGLLLRREPSCPSIWLERALWSLAVQPRRSGHRSVRPWLLSTDLLAERLRVAGPGNTRAPLHVHLQRCSRYVAALFTDNAS
jgi:hypothetical protein